MNAALPVLAVTGLLAEARIAAGSGIVTIAGGGDALGLARRLEAALARGAVAVISFGIAGGLARGMRPGASVIGRRVHDGARLFACDPGWNARLVAALPRATLGDILGVAEAVHDVGGKAALRDETGALAVDMESHVAARLAARHGIPFAALRVVSDPMQRRLPEAALVGMRADGSTDVGAVLRALRRRPGDLPALIRTAFDARAALAALATDRRRLSPRLGFDEHPAL